MNCLFPSSPQHLHLHLQQQLQSIWHQYWRSRPRPHRPCRKYGVSPAENHLRAQFLASFPLVQEEGRTSWNMHNAVVVAAAAVDDDHVAAATRQQHSRADMVDMRSAAVHTVRTCTPGGAIPEEYRSRREHLGNDNWSEMGTACRNQMQWPAAAAAAAEIAATVRSSEVDTGNGRRSREAEHEMEGDRRS